MGTPLTFPTLVKRLVKGSEMTFAEGDANLSNIQAFCEALANLLAVSMNPDGTLIANSVGAAALQAASVQLSNLNPALLYSIVPVDNDIGTVQGAYAITARGGLAGSNLIPGGAVYDANGNYTVAGLTLNFGYYWTKGANDTSCQVPDSAALTVAGSFTALTSGVVLTGTPGAPITSTLVQSAPINAYQDGMMFFVYTGNANIGAATLNVNNLGAIPIMLYGQPLNTGAILAQGVFAVVYKGGVFVLFSGGGSGASGGSGGNTTVVTTTGYSGISAFTTPSTALVATGLPSTASFAHGLGAIPTSFLPTMLCLAADSGYAAGMEVPMNSFVDATGINLAFAFSANGSTILLTQLIAAPYVANPSSGALVAITLGSWVMQAAVSVASNFSGVAAFPAVSYQAFYLQGAISYGQNLFTFTQSNQSSHWLINLINTLNGEMTPVNRQSVNNYGYVNPVVFPASFGISGGSDVIAFTCYSGLYWMPAQNPNQNYISPGLAYDGSGSASTELLVAGTYIWTPSKNDTQLVVGAATYLASNASNGQISVVVVGTSVTGLLTGAAGTVITGILLGSSTTWQATAFNQQFNGYGLYDTKPVWYNAADALNSSNPAFYTVSSNYDSGVLISAIWCYQLSTTSSRQSSVWATGNTAALDLTSSNITGFAALQKWYSAGSPAKVIFFQYNPIKRRIYVQTNEVGGIHIFQLGGTTNDFSTFWNTASPARENLLTYVKTVAIGSGPTSAISDIRNCNQTIEINPATGAEVCIVQAWDGGSHTSFPGAVVRIPWVE